MNEHSKHGGRRPASSHAGPLWPVAVLVLAGGLQGCGRGVDSGATSSAVAPGRPGTGNAVVEVSPVPGSINESPGIGGSRGLIAEGITGNASPSQAAPGVGLDGGLGSSPGDERERAASTLGAASAPGTGEK